MKKLLLLGGSAQQVVVIETAKRLGYYTVLCDFLPDNPGQYAADRFYLVSTTDKEAVLRVAEEEAVDGVVAYASDPAAPTAAYVAEKLHLPGNPCEAVNTLCNKDRFRKFLEANDLNAPRSGGYSEAAAACADAEQFHFPVIVKPVDSSGSKGTTVLKDAKGLQAAADFAFSYSRSHRIIVEEFIVRKHPYLIGGDIFVSDGQIRQWGLMNCHRDERVNPLVPVGKSYPLLLDQADIGRVKTYLQTMVDRLGFRTGAMNVELVIDTQDRVRAIDIGPRNGGNMIPDLLGYIFGTDVAEMTVKAAMGQPINDFGTESKVFYATHNLHTDKNGRFEGVEYSEEIRPFIIRKSVYKRAGDRVEYFDNAAKAIGIVFMKFDSREQMMQLLGDIGKHIRVLVN